MSKKKNKKKIIETIPDKSKLDEIVSEYLKEQKYFSEIIIDFFKSINFKWGDGGIDDYKLIRKNIYEITIIDEVGVNRKEYIKCETTLRVNIKTEEIRCINKKIIKSTLNIKKRELNKFNRIISNELKKIKKLN